MALLPESASAEPLYVFQTKGGHSFTVLRVDEANMILHIQEERNRGTIRINRDNTATKETFVDLSRFRIEGNVPRNRKVRGTYNPDTEQFTFGTLVYSLKRG